MRYLISIFSIKKLLMKAVGREAKGRLHSQVAYNFGRPTYRQLT